MKRAITLAILSFAATAIAVQRRASPTETPRNTPRATVTFNQDVAPILYGNCTTCHHVGGAGPFPLIDYEDAKSHARQIAAVTSRRFMPPWPPDREVRFKDERGLSDGQIATLKQWAESGAPEGPPGKAPAPPEYPDGWQLGRPGIVVQAAAYCLRMGRMFTTTLYFVFRSGLGSTYARWISGPEMPRSCITAMS